jgi:hypothetical protein
VCRSGRTLVGDGALLLSTQSSLRRRHACRGPPGPSCDAGNNPCRRQADRVIALTLACRAPAEDDRWRRIRPAAPAPMSSPSTSWLAVGGLGAQRRRERPDRLDGAGGVVFVVCLRMAPARRAGERQRQGPRWFEKGAARCPGSDGHPPIGCIDRGSQRVATASSRMQERNGLRSRAGGRSQLVRSERASTRVRDARSSTEHRC